MLTNFDLRYVFFSNQIKNFMSKRNESFATYYLIKFIIQGFESKSQCIDGKILFFNDIEK